MSRVVNQSLAVVQRFPYLGMFSSVVRWQFFVDLPDVIDGFRGLVSDSLRSGSVPSLLWPSPPLLRLGSLGSVSRFLGAGLGLPAAPDALGHVEELAEPHGSTCPPSCGSPRGLRSAQSAFSRLVPHSDLQDLPGPASGATRRPWPLATPPETKDRTSQPPERSCQSP